ncbi:hypothetical protein CONLIGDRAFT_62144 [Coniochaeta ligniaria NRRL 30616]|uniref:NACHT domain-containing protein n=1 Tax=Coniochaeta ligniaria NRRL 30616 TaxID=1408157 RepID=A0A1J7J847_9PEZI|nr:hypothetical protein CONLIGDRAFT_62144 [Coniochaeta ligniaria NRRL 30616]
MLRKFGRRSQDLPHDLDEPQGSWDSKPSDERHDSDRRASDSAASARFSSSTSGNLRPESARRPSAPAEPASSVRRRISKRGTSPSIDKLGLSVVHSAPEPLADLIFVHGLGGTSTRTWSWQRDPEHFWPSWLEDDAELCHTRVFTFGYTADFFGQSTSSSILDFARQLLFQLKTYSDAQRPRDMPIGTYPLVFVMHSMGGLVVKKAFIIGSSDELYQGIISQVHAMLFLGTPHRGSNHADFLNNVLRSIPSLSSKIYVAEMEKASTSLHDINEQFRTMCANLELVSLYENQKTSIAVGIKKLIVDRDSAVLGYPTEISSGLNADHHGMCKFASKNDPNYEQVRNVLRMFLRRFRPNGDSESIGNPLRMDFVLNSSKKKLEKLFGIHDDPKNDYELIRDRSMDGTCRWILHRQAYRDWRYALQSTSKVLWLTGLPGAGKSVLSSFIINSLQKDPSTNNCFYYFFKSDHQRKRRISYMLCSMAFQFAMSSTAICEKMIELEDADSISFSEQKVNSIWEAVFEGILFRQPFDGPIFWIIDGLDEADHPELLVKLLAKLPPNNIFRVLIVSRPMREVALHSITNIEVTHNEITYTDTEDDIRNYTNATISTTLHNDAIRDEICDNVLQKAQGSFLWVTLALDQLKENWHTRRDINQILNDLPEGMEPLYSRMIQTIADQPARPRAIASKVLTWAVCSFRPLTISELEVALLPEFGEFLSLENTIRQTCGNFILAGKSRVALIHDTARHFLLHKTAGLPITVDLRTGHGLIADTSLKFLMDQKRNWKRTLALAQAGTISTTGKLGNPAFFDNHPFLSYATRWWPYHVSLSTPHSDLAPLVHDFLDQMCLVWIHAVALLGDMRILTRAAQYLKLFVKRRNKSSSHESLRSLKGSRDDELKQWAKDLIRIVGRFGDILLRNPLSIYKHIVPFCPTGSIISQTFAQASSLSIDGITSDTWDDCLARLTMGTDEFPSKVLCKGAFFVTVIGHGVLIVWHAESCEEWTRLDHGEWISVVEASRASSLLATAGLKTIRVWDVSTGEELHRLPKASDRRILALSFGAGDGELLVGYDDSSFQCINLTTSQETWKYSLEDPGDSEHLCPHLISISPDNYQVIVGYRGKPMFAWNLDALDRGPQVCTRPEDRSELNHDASTWKAGTPERVLWRPGLPAVLVLYNDTALFEWNIEEDVQRLIPEIRAIEMALSSDGNLLLTSDHNGALSIWTVPEFRLTYQLQEPDMVRSLAFSPNGQRFYDIRGPLCNVWEPDALVRTDDLDREEASSSQDTLLSEHVSATSGVERAQITAIVCDGDDQFYCCGKDSGVVILHEIDSGRKVRKVYGHAAIASVIEMAWSRASRYIASADDCGRVIAKRLRTPTPENPTWGVFPLLDFRPGEAISQLLFSPSEQFLLVSCPNINLVWSLKSRQEICRAEPQCTTSYRWLNEPGTELLLLVDSHGIRKFEWQSLKEVGLRTLESVEERPKAGPSQALSLGQLSLDRAPSLEVPLSIERPTPVNASQVVFDACPATGTNRTYISEREVMVAEIPNTLPTSVRPITGLADYVNRLVGCYNGHVVFLDRHYCFCTCDIRVGSRSVKRHFYLPKDWLSPNMLKLCTINAHGTILCPKNGEIAVIRGGIKL